MVIRVPVGTVVREVRWEIEGEAEKEREEREALEWAWDASKVRLAEAERREKRWDAWKKKKEVLIKEGEDYDVFDEHDPVPVEEHKQAALERIRKTLFVTYPLTDLASHPSFLFSEHQLLSKLLSRQAANSGKKTRRRRTRVLDEEDIPLYLDLTKPTPASDPILLLSGGPPGLGNPSFQSASDRSPKYATRGGDGEMMRLELEVKAGGEVGLVGMPNAGKRFVSSPSLLAEIQLTTSARSTILRALTSSTPRVAAYPFTTLNPHHGTCVLYSDSTFSGPRTGTSISDTLTTPESFSATSHPSSREDRRRLLDAPSTPRTEIMRFTITDNPGLVPLSSLNVGLGHAFLRHIERCAALVYVVDLSAADPVGALDSVRKELREYARMKGLQGELEGRVRGVVANKADLFGPASGKEVGMEEDPSMRSSAEEGQRKLAELEKYVREMEANEVEEGIRSEEDKVWIVPTSAKERQNVAALVQKLATTVRSERERTLTRIAEEERLVEEEKEQALDMLAAARSR